MAFDPISAAFDFGRDLIGRLIPDPKQKADALLKLEEMRQSGDLAVISGQNKINEIEAGNANIFVSGWRPFIGWVCGSALAFQLVLGPMIVWCSTIVNRPVALPIMQTELLTTLLVGMLGLGGLRTVEKLQGKA